MNLNKVTALFFFLALAACTPSTAIPPTAAPSSTPVTPTPDDLIPATATPEGTLYEYGDFGFRVRIPPGFRVEELPPGPGLGLSLVFIPPPPPVSNPPPNLEEIPTPDPAQASPFDPPIGLFVYLKPASEPLDDWFAAHVGGLTESAQPTPPEALFIDPTVHNRDEFKGYPALQYESGSRPIPYETVIDRGAWAIGLYFLKDYPQDYEMEYEQLLASLELFEPTGGPIAAASPPPTTTPSVCLDEAAAPRALPPRQTPLEVQFTSDGNIWAWKEEVGVAEQISDTGDAQTFSFSPDGEVVAFTRGPLYEQTELWGIDRDGTGLRLLVSAEQLHEMAGEPTTTEFTYTNEIGSVHWIDGTHTLGFTVQRFYNAIGGCCDLGGYWQVNVDTGALSAWTPPAEFVNGEEGMLSPDGSQRAIFGAGTLSLVNADGTNLRENVFSFSTQPFYEGPGTNVPLIEWALDSQSLLAITFEGDVYEDDTRITTWRIPLDGSPAEELYTFSTMYFWVRLSPNQEYLAYKRRVRPFTNDYELHLATFDGARDLVYAAQTGLEFLHWHPDSYHFVYEQFGIGRPYLGSVCGGAAPLLDTAETPATRIVWVDGTRFLFVKGSLDPFAGLRELRLGQIGGPSILIGPFNGESAQAVFNVETAPLGGDGSP